MTTVDVVNIFAAVTSIVLAIVALVLSVFFFVQSKRDAERSTHNSTEISSSVAKLEKLFDSLYADTFSMMRETYTDMRQHVWTAVPGVSDQASEDQSEPQLSPETSALMDEIAEVSRRVGLNETRVTELSHEVGPIINRSLNEAGSHGSPADRSRPVTRQRLANYLKMKGQEGATLSTLARRLDAAPDDFVSELFRMARLGQVTWEGAPSSLGGDAVITWVPLAERAKREGASDPGS